ncbi:nucleic acid/nucleotide deaminase domain-containing protein [Nonomuraea antimicrobica]
MKKRIALKKAAVFQARQGELGQNDESDDMGVPPAAPSRSPTLLDTSTPKREQRRQASLGWLLTHYNLKRVCVAVLYEPGSGGTQGKMILAANNGPEGMKEQAEKILKAQNEAEVDQVTRELLETYSEALKDRKARGRKKPFDKWPKDEQTKFKAAITRRVKKVNAYLRSLAPAPQFTVTDHARVPDQHCEMRLVDDLLQRSSPTSTNGVSLGISKLCCAKCYLALEALVAVKNIKIDVQGAHMGVFPKWPLPRFLDDPLVMEKFLGPDAYARYERNPEIARETIQNLEDFQGGGSKGKIDYESSGEET